MHKMVSSVWNGKCSSDDASTANCRCFRFQGKSPRTLNVTGPPVILRPDSPPLGASQDQDSTDQDTAISSANTAKIMGAFFAGQGLSPDVVIQERRRAAWNQPRHTSHASTPPPEVRRKLHLDTSAMQDNISTLQPYVEVIKPPPKRTFGQLPVAQGPPWHRSLFLEQWKP